MRPILGVGLFTVALLVLDRQLHAHTLAQVTAQLYSIPNGVLLIALGLTIASYVTLTFYDLLALRYVKESLPYYKVSLTSFIAYVFSMDLGLTVLGSSAIRYRLYTLWGLSAGNIAKIVAFSSFTFFVGVLGVGGFRMAMTMFWMKERTTTALTMPIVALMMKRPLSSSSWVSVLRRMPPLPDTKWSR